MTKSWFSVCTELRCHDKHSLSWSAYYSIAHSGAHLLGMDDGEVLRSGGPRLAVYQNQTNQINKMDSRAIYYISNLLPMGYYLGHLIISLT